MTAAVPHTVTLAWTPGQNGGQVSTLRGRVPLAAILGLLEAGEGVWAVTHDYGLDIEEVLVLDRLRRDMRRTEEPATPVTSPAPTTKRDM